MYGPMMTAVLSTNDLYNSPADIKANYRARLGGVDHAVAVSAIRTMRACHPTDTGSLRIVGVPRPETEPAIMTFLTATSKFMATSSRSTLPSITPARWRTPPGRAGPAPGQAPNELDQRCRWRHLHLGEPGNQFDLRRNWWSGDHQRHRHRPRHYDQFRRDRLRLQRRQQRGVDGHRRRHHRP